MHKFFYHSLNQSEKHTFKLHLAYSVIEGIVLGIFALNEFVLLKSLNGTNFQVGLLFQFSAFVLTFSVVFNEWTNRTRNKKKLIILTALITRLPLFIPAFFPPDVINSPYLQVFHYIFLGAFLSYYFANPIFLPVINQILKNNYSHDNFSKLFSYATSANKLVMLLITFIYGVWLDYDFDIYRFIVPIAGFFAVISILLLLKAFPEENITCPDYGSFMGNIKASWQKMRGILKKNHSFRNFETSFMFYGFAFMGTVSVITIFYDKELQLNYSSIAFYKNSFNILAIALLPFAGKLLGKIGPKKFSVLSFASILFYLLFTGLTEYIPANTTVAGVQIYYSLIPAIVFNGVFIAAMSILWSIGSAYFCNTSETADYQAIHLTFTGVRSFFAPMLGVLFYEVFGFTGAFIAGIVLLLISIYVALK